MKKVVIFFILITLCMGLHANVDATVGNIRIVIEDYSGSVSIYRKANDDTFVPMFDSKTFTKSPAFFALYSDAVLPVNSSGGFKITSTFQDARATFTAVLRNKLEITVNYDLFATTSNGVVDAIAVSTSILNLSNTDQEVALKAFFDTWLGENTLTHFTTSLLPSITSETLFTNIRNDKWIQSANSTDVIRFIVPQDQINAIDSIIVANKNQLSSLVWNYNVQRGREFHSLNSYNNSALAITWKNFILGKDAHKDIEFYLLTGETSVQIAATWPPETTSTSSVSAQTVNPFAHLSDEDLQKILEILDTINELKENNNYLSEQEIISLNAEVDSILENARR